MTSSLNLIGQAHPYFNLKESGKYENFENPILKKIFGKNGWRLSRKDEEYLKNKPQIGTLISGSNNLQLHQRLEKSRNPMKKI